MSEIMEEKKVCPRCLDRHLVGDFQGEYCRWCVEDFGRIGDEAPIQDGRDLLTSSDVSSAAERYGRMLGHDLSVTQRRENAVRRAAGASGITQDDFGEGCEAPRR